MTTEGPTVGLHLESRPHTLTIVRGMLGGLAEVLSIDPELLDDLKTSISEACNNVVLHAYGGEPGPMRILLYVGSDEMRVVVQDDGAGLPAADDSLDEGHGIGISVMRALTGSLTFSSEPGAGTEVTMRFAGERDGRPLYVAPEPPQAKDLETNIDGDAVVLTLSPVSLMAPVLGRLARTLAATAHFSLDRFSDVYLVTDTIAAHAATAAKTGRVGARLTAAERRLELLTGPFHVGSSAAIEAGAADRSSPLALLSDDISVRVNGSCELLDVVVVDHRR